MRIIEGKSSRHFAPIIGEIVIERRPFYDRSKAILVTPRMDTSVMGYKGCITSGAKGNFFHPDHIYEARALESLREGDIVRLDAGGLAHVLWEDRSHQNALFVTEACNCQCLMCPQPPRAHDPELLRQALHVLRLLRGRRLDHLCITGGEPTLLGDNFLNLLDRCVREHPEAKVDVLTNGKAFANKTFARRTSELATDNVLFCVSLHAEVDCMHDELVGCKGSWSATQQGIYNLATYGCKMEIRHVITRRNFSRLCSFAEHMYNYFPFCAHYAFMGVELHGNAAKNKEIVDISPYEYKQELRAAVMTMHRRGLPVSVYNVPLCLCEPEVRPFAKQSISTWKNAYLPQCDACCRKLDCAGFFSTSVSLPIKHIQPFKEGA